MLPFLLLLFAASLTNPSGVSGQSPASRPRVALVPTVGYTNVGLLYQHDPRYDPAALCVGSCPSSSPYEYRDLTRLQLKGAPTAGVRLSVPLGGRWTAYADGMYGATEFEDREEKGAYSRGALVHGDELMYHSDASIAAFATGVTARLRLPRVGAELDLGLGGALNRFSLERPDCRPSPPSQGYFGSTCGPFFGAKGAPWKGTYNVPSAVGAVALRRRLVGRFGFEGRAGYSVGRANTESFYFDLIPELDRYEAPKRSTVQTLQLSTGLSVEL